MTESASVAGRDIVERLRTCAANHRGRHETGDAMNEAADQIATLTQERDALWEALNEVRTNGEWTGGDQAGEWKISKEVYGLVCDALTETSRCPHPAKGDPDNTTVRECIERGHCGCDNAKALTGERRL